MLDFIKEGLLQVQPGMLIWTLITFALLVYVLWKYAWGIIIDALDKRSQKVEESIKHADHERKIADGLLAERQKILLNAKQEAMDIISKTKSRTVEIKDNILNDTKKESEQLFNKAYRDIEQIRRKALYDFKKDIVDVTFRITNKFVRKQIDYGEGARLIDHYLEKYKEDVIKKQ